MELFATDRDRLAFLLETDAALDLDFETLEALRDSDSLFLIQFILLQPAVL